MKRGIKFICFPLGWLVASCGQQEPRLTPQSAMEEISRVGQTLGSTQDTINEPVEVLHLTAVAEEYYCPTDFHFDANQRLCLSEDEALGPFPEKMVERCQTFGGGTACQESNWSAEFAASIRGNEVCPLGTTRDTTGLCVDGQFAYGPFLKTHVEACHEAGGGQACDTLRWDRTFALAVLPEDDSTEMKDAFTFPFTGPANADYTVPPRKFGSCRSGCQRKHAASDLYGSIGRPVYAVGQGKVLDFHYFYDGTHALVVDHGQFVVRYGEIKGKLPSGVGVGSTVKRGQKIAYVGDLVSLNIQMLHFERFSGKGSGPLTVRSNYPYQRRWDLQNPQADLIKWRYPR